MVLMSISPIGKNTVNNVIFNEGSVCSSLRVKFENSSGTALKGKRLPSNFKNKGPPISEAANPTIKPKIITVPTSAPNLLVT
ncbi:hypothetical protein D3C72_1923960 [compost metagenome]